VIVVEEDFLTNARAALANGGDRGLFPGTMGGPAGEADSVRSGGEEVVEAVVNIRAKAEFVAAGIANGLELEKIEIAPR
jgi:hypothetical protein